MINGAIFRKSTRDSLWLLVLVASGIFLLEMLFVGALNEFSGDLRQTWLQKTFFQRFAKVLVGADLGTDLNTTALMTIGMAHPLLFALNWAFLLTVCTRVPVGEIERGTADLLLSLPVSRFSIYSSVSLTWALAGIPIAVAPWLGVRAGSVLFAMDEPPHMTHLAMLLPNMWAMYLCIGGATMLASSIAPRRGPAIATVLAWLLSSFLLNFLGQFWSVAERFGAVGLLHYYRPLPIVRSGSVPWADSGILLAVGIVCWAAGAWHFQRRDIPAA